MSTYEESIEKYDRIKAVDLSKICNDTNKLKLVAEDLQRELLQVYGDRREAIRNEPGQSTTNEKTQISNTNLSSTPAFWSGLEWIPAQCDYPTDTATTKSIGFGSSHMEILVYDCSRGTLEVWHGLEKLQGMICLHRTIHTANLIDREKSIVLKTSVSMVLGATCLCGKDHQTGVEECAKI